MNLPNPIKQNKINIFQTLIIGSVGGLLANFTGIAGAWLVGSMLFIFLIGLFKTEFFLPKFFRNIALGFAGLTIGETITEDTIGLFIILPQTILYMIISLTLFILISFYFYKKFWNTESLTALACTWPGNLLLIFEILNKHKTEMKLVAMVQAVRIFTLFLILPTIISIYTKPSIEDNFIFSFDLIIAIILTIICIIISMKTKFLGGELIITAFLLGFLNSNGIIEFSIPKILNSFFQIILGTFIALELLKCDRKFFFHSLKPSLFSALFAGVFTITTAFLVSQMVNYPFPALALSFAPGGAEAMIILSVVFDVDPSFVGIHHTLRLLILTILFPIIAKQLSKK